jgi:hypothetical protein
VYIGTRLCEIVLTRSPETAFHTWLWSSIRVSRCSFWNQQTNDRQRTMTRRTMWREDTCRLCYIGRSPQVPCVSP